jgi:hypothetical protein
VVNNAMMGIILATMVAIRAVSGEHFAEMRQLRVENNATMEIEIAAMAVIQIVRQRFQQQFAEIRQ